MTWLKRILEVAVNGSLAVLHWSLVLFCLPYFLLCVFTSFETPTVRRLRRDFA